MEWQLGEPTVPWGMLANHPYAEFGKHNVSPLSPQQVATGYRALGWKWDDLCSQKHKYWGIPETFCWVRAFSSACDAPYPPRIPRLVSEPLLRASAFCTNINILYLPRQPAVKNSFSSKFCFDSLQLSLWATESRISYTHLLLSFSSPSTIFNIL